jgi:hypothetical protein
MKAGLLNWRLAWWLTIPLLPLALAAASDPSMNVVLFIFKTYVVALYFAVYLQSMRLTIVEFVCFAIPVMVSFYFFLYPRASDMMGRLSGISEPNFTSLSLIIAMCGAFGIYELTKARRVKFIALATALICITGVILTASRAGLVGTAIALCLFLVIRGRKRNATMILAVVAVIMIFDLQTVLIDNVYVLQRIQDSLGKGDMAGAYTSERYYTERAWNTVQSGDWFIGGNPRQISESSHEAGIPVPHNSLLDIGLTFGKASFYFYGALLVVLLGINLRCILSKKWRQRTQNDRGIIVAPILFISLFPMYMSLSAGLAMDYVLWMVLGAYPLLRLTPTAIEEDIS